MEPKPKKPLQDDSAADATERPAFWDDILFRAFTGWEPADQALERIIDRMERNS